MFLSYSAVQNAVQNALRKIPETAAVGGQGNSRCFVFAWPQICTGSPPPFKHTDALGLQQFELVKGIWFTTEKNPPKQETNVLLVVLDFFKEDEDQRRRRSVFAQKKTMKRCFHF